MSKEEVEEVRGLMDTMDKNLMSFWGYERLKTDEVEVRDFINSISEYGHKGRVLFLLQEIKDIFIILEVSDNNTIKFEYSGFGINNYNYYPFFNNMSIIELLQVYIPRFEKSMIHLFKIE